MDSETVLITGASSGIGLELARCFAKSKSRLILVARRELQLNALADELAQQHEVSVKVMPADLTQRAERERLFSELREEQAEVDVLVNNAGFGLNGIFHQFDTQAVLDLIELNVAALAHLTRLFLPEMVARSRGGILNVASTAAFQAGPRMAAYYASKAFVLSFSEAIHEEVRREGVRVSCLCPGPTITEFAKVARMERARMFKFGPMSAESVAAIGYHGFRRNRAIIIPGIGNWLMANISRHVPRSLSRKVARQLQ